MAMDKSLPDIGKFKDLAKSFRKEILEIIHEAGSGHPGGSLSLVEILTSLYFYKINQKPQKPDWDNRDRVVISKGHASPVVYVVLANRGYFPKDELVRFRKLGSYLQGHVVTEVPGVELSSGSLGQGLSFANGIAIGAKLRKDNFRTYCILGDGEIQEGSVWEAAMTAGFRKLDNICAILDNNGVQENGPIREIKNTQPIAKKWTDFGWHVIEIDGHNFGEIIAALDEFDTVKGKPTFILANTIKGKGVSFMEGNNKWHGKAPDDQQLQQALSEINEL
jgi:transketolase